VPTSTLRQPVFFTTLTRKIFPLPWIFFAGGFALPTAPEGHTLGLGLQSVLSEQPNF
jgi:hypothetical protein